jgi:hypothetical protein
MCNQSIQTVVQMQKTLRFKFAKGKQNVNTCTRYFARTIPFNSRKIHKFLKGTFSSSFAFNQFFKNQI